MRGTVKVTLLLATSCAVSVCVTLRRSPFGSLSDRVSTSPTLARAGTPTTVCKPFSNSVALTPLVASAIVTGAVLASQLTVLTNVCTSPKVSTVLASLPSTAVSMAASTRLRLAVVTPDTPMARRSAAVNATAGV